MLVVAQCQFGSAVAGRRGPVQGAATSGEHGVG